MVNLICAECNREYQLKQRTVYSRKYRNIPSLCETCMKNYQREKLKNRPQFALARKQWWNSLSDEERSERMSNLYKYKKAREEFIKVTCPECNMTQNKKQRYNKKYKDNIFKVCMDCKKKQRRNKICEKCNTNYIIEPNIAYYRKTHGLPNFCYSCLREYKNNKQKEYYKNIKNNIISNKIEVTKEHRILICEQCNNEYIIRRTTSLYRKRNNTPSLCVKCMIKYKSNKTTQTRKRKRYERINISKM